MRAEKASWWQGGPFRWVQSSRQERWAPVNWKAVGARVRAYGLCEPGRQVTLSFALYLKVAFHYCMVFKGGTVMLHL